MADTAAGRKRTGCWLVVLLALLVALPLMAAPVAAAEPADVISRFNETLIEAMKRSGELGYAGRYRLLEPVIRESFALPQTARIAAGRYWSTMKEDERKEYLDVYRRWTVATYAGRFNGYSGERFRVASTGKGGGSRVRVSSILTKGDGEEIPFDYELRRDGSAWRIVDIRIEGVSQLALTRSQFTSTLRKKGFPALIASLREKIRKMEKEK